MESWPSVVERLSACSKCRDSTSSYPGARPLFCKFRGERSDVFFVLEAPNHDDTFDPATGYLITEADTDPSGRFFRELHVDVLGEPIEHAAITNAVLCLPAGSAGRYLVTSTTVRNCSSNLRAQVAALDPLIVVSVGGKALDATRLIDDHRLRKMSEAVAKPITWFGRTLFPVFHTGMLARNGPSGRPADKQREDWAKLRELLRTLRAASDRDVRDKDRRAGLRELSRLTQEFGGYDAELK